VKKEKTRKIYESTSIILYGILNLDMKHLTQDHIWQLHHIEKINKQVIQKLGRQYNLPKQALIQVRQ
jgi:hypothetical protein